MQSPQLDPVAVAVLLASLIFGPTLAEIIGPYAIIFLGAGTGARLRHPRGTQDQEPGQCKHAIH